MKTIKMTFCLWLFILGTSNLKASETPHKTLIGNETFNVLNYEIYDSTFKYFLDSSISTLVPFDGKWCILYNNGHSVYSIFEIHAGKINGICYVYYSNGNICSYSTVIDDKRNGLYIHWNKDGTLDHTGVFNHGIIASNLYYFNSKGKIKTILYFQNGYFIGSKNKLLKRRPLGLLTLINSINYYVPLASDKV